MENYFAKLDKEKQQAIINAALSEFAANKYEQASTNRIVQQAGIGKGMLFHYFNSKQELYYYLVEYSLVFVKTEYVDKLDAGETDFIKKCSEAAELKMRAIRKNPHVFAFAGSIYLNKVELPPELAERVAGLMAETQSKLYQNIDTTLFRNDVEPATVMKLIQWSMEGIQNEITNNLRGKELTSQQLANWDLSEFYDYMDVLRKVFYK